MSGSRCSWNGLKECVNAISQTRSAQCVYSFGSGFSVASSVAYVGALFSSCVSPAVTCCFASTACVATTAITYQQLSSNGGRIGDLERKSVADEKRIQQLEEKIEKLEAAYNQLDYASRQSLFVLDKIVAKLPDEAMREECDEVLESPREEMGVLIKKNPMPGLDSLLVNQSEHKKVKMNPHSLYGDFRRVNKSKPPARQVFVEEDADADQLLSKNLDEMFSDSSYRAMRA